MLSQGLWPAEVKQQSRTSRLIELVAAAASAAADCRGLASTSCCCVDMKSFVAATLRLASALTSSVADVTPNTRRQTPDARPLQQRGKGEDDDNGSSHRKSSSKQRGRNRR